MKRYLLLFCILLFGAFHSLTGLELSFIGGTGNFKFDEDATSALGAAGEQFSVNYYPLWNIRAEQGINDFLNFTIGLERDAILRNMVSTSVILNAGIARIEMGPFFGIFNSRESVINPGISAEIRLEVPGIIFGSFQAGSTMSAGLSVPGDYSQGFSTLTLGFWVPNVIPTISINSKTYTERKEADLTVKDEHTRYQFTADMFMKNVPYTFRVDLGYQTLKRSYVSSAASDTDELRSVFVGFEGKFQVKSFLKILAGIETPVYSWGKRPLKSPGLNTFMFELRLGAIWTIERNE